MISNSKNQDVIYDSKDEFESRIHRFGIVTTLLLWVMFIGVPAGITIFFGLKIDIAKLLTASVPIAVVFGVTGLCEKLSMTPIIGPGAVYLASATGNVQNMKLPAALNAMRVMNCEEGTEKGRVISILAVATSSFVTTIIVFLGMAFLAPIVAPVLSNPIIKPAFDNMFPALLGPMVIPAVIKNPKESIIPFTIAIIFAVILGSMYGNIQGIVMAAVILLSLGIFKFLYNKKSSKNRI